MCTKLWTQFTHIQWPTCMIRSCDYCLAPLGISSFSFSIQNVWEISTMVNKIACLCEKGFVWSDQLKNWHMLKPRMATPTRKPSMKQFAGLSLIPTSQFVAWVSLLFAFPSSEFSVLELSPLALHTALFTTTDMSVAWHGSVGSITWMGLTRYGCLVCGRVCGCTCSHRLR